MPYYRVRHNSTRKNYRAEASSKTQLKKRLTRYDDVTSEYHSFWDIMEVNLGEWNMMKYMDIDLVPDKYMS